MPHCCGKRVHSIANCEGKAKLLQFKGLRRFLAQLGAQGFLPTDIRRIDGDHAEKGLTTRLKAARPAWYATPRTHGAIAEIWIRRGYRSEQSSGFRNYLSLRGAARGLTRDRVLGTGTLFQAGAGFSRNILRTLSPGLPRGLSTVTPRD